MAVLALSPVRGIVVMLAMNSTAFDFEGVVRGGWLWTGEELLERGGVLGRGGRVAALLAGDEPDPRGSAVIDLPRALVHPGLLNAHAHLDLTGLCGVIPPGLPFPRWLCRVRDHRQEVGEAGLIAAAADGISALVETGTTRVVDYSYGGHSEGALRESQVRATVLREVIGPDPDRAAEAAASAREWLLRRPDAGRLSYGLAPHSTYLATGELIRECRRIASGRPFSLHAAELAGEGRLLREGTGELRDFLEEIGVDPSQFQPGKGPIEYLEKLGVLKNALLVHAGYLEANDADRIGAGGGVVVFCPQSHRYFDRPPHPLPDLLSKGVPVVLGTDSAASNPELSVAGEMREVRRTFPGLPAESIFALGTGRLSGPALPDSPGDLRPGAPLDLAAVDLPPSVTAPLSDFLSEPHPNILTMVGGRVLHGVGLTGGLSA